MTKIYADGQKIAIPKINKTKSVLKYSKVAFSQKHKRSGLKLKII